MRRNNDIFNGGRSLQLAVWRIGRSHFLSTASPFNRNEGAKREDMERFDHVGVKSDLHI